MVIIEGEYKRAPRHHCKNRSTLRSASPDFCRPSLSNIKEALRHLLFLDTLHRLRADTEIFATLELSHHSRERQQFPLDQLLFHYHVLLYVQRPWLRRSFTLTLKHHFTFHLCHCCKNCEHHIPCGRVLSCLKVFFMEMHRHAALC